MELSIRWLLVPFCLFFAGLSQASIPLDVEKRLTEHINDNSQRNSQASIPRDVDERLTKHINGNSQRNSQASAPMDVGERLVDKVLVVKSERKLLLLSQGQPIKSYRVSLGKQPKGPKLREGDQRTPEGIYWIDWRKVSDKFNLSMHISYPNIRDLARARAEGVPPGSMIMLHGTPLDETYPEWYFQGLDWTEGCIAMRNDDMREVWSLVKDGTLIEIRP